MKATSIQQRATAADYKQLPEGVKYQLIEGEITDIPSPSYLHQKIVGKIFVELDLALRDKKQAEAIVAPMDVHLDEENIYQPDIFLICYRTGRTDAGSWISGGTRCGD